MHLRYFLVLVIAALPMLSAYASEDMPDWNTTTLTGDWGGVRSAQFQNGFIWSFTHKSDFLANLSGGIRRGANWMGYTEGGVRMELDKLLGWDSTLAYIHLHSELGTQFNQKYVGSYIGMDNIETAANTVQFNHIWLQKNLSADSFSILTGLYAIDSEFYVTDTSGVFIQPPYGMANDMAQSGVNGPPIYPMGALALRLKYTSHDGGFYSQYALTDGVPGDPDYPRGTHLQLNSGDGTLSIIEFGYTPQAQSLPGDKGKAAEPVETFNKTALGYWRYSARFSDIDTSIPESHHDAGVYVLTERSLIQESDHPSQGLAGFFRFGTASRNLHQSDWSSSLGLRYHGILENRDDDIAGIAVTYNHTSDKYRLINNAESGQVQYEATYRAQVKPWFVLQPSLQYIVNPNMDPSLDNSWNAVVRVEIAL